MFDRNECSSILDLPMKANGQIRQRPGFRILAAAFLFVWLAAMGICSAHCSLGFLSPKSRGKTQCCHHEGSKENSKNSSCLINQSAPAIENAFIQLHTEWQFSYLLTPVALLQDASLTQTLVSPIRQGMPTDWPAMPEVYLGAAYFSLAPPLQS
jgi:hypothetical protein